MDYHSIHGRDISSFGIPDTHRLPTVAASQALDSLKREPVTSLTTGIDRLDSALGSASHDFTENSTHCGGIKRGQVTEVWGPPGTGKSALAYDSRVQR
ncbi:hypothetical protein HIM_00549 [Hirsutella minnesotensis 3608]|nr:hypothetical protein HIM_00549 [Hirsutella minnesotensis 3608]